MIILNIAQMAIALLLLNVHPVYESFGKALIFKYLHHDLDYLTRR